MSQYIVGGNWYRELPNGKFVPARGVNLESIKQAYIEGGIDLEEFERRVNAFLYMEEESVPYAEAYLLANGLDLP